MEMVLDPPRGVGPIRLGMTPSEARAALETIGRLEPAVHGELAVNLPSGLGLSVGFGVGSTRDRVNAIEVWRPQGLDVVRYRDVDIFGLPAIEVVKQIRRYADLQPNEHDDAFTASDLYLALWRPFASEDPQETQGHFFQSALVARPGYGDTPAQAAARRAAGGEPGY